VKGRSSLSDHRHVLGPFGFKNTEISVSTGQQRTGGPTDRGDRNGIRLQGFGEGRSDVRDYDSGKRRQSPRTEEEHTLLIMGEIRAITRKEGAYGCRLVRTM